MQDSMNFEELFFAAGVAGPVNSHIKMKIQDVYHLKCRCILGKCQISDCSFNVSLIIGQLNPQLHNVDGQRAVAALIYLQSLNVFIFMKSGYSSRQFLDSFQ